ncbi:hypothetical protein Leryth_020091 [Lithospermum erythrorhizon]|uniref:C2 domain-containing protein n=1 Tax=Lithospermum erythrorhizon TaxID=34254 RepID=A0AAV3QN53_LITER|nr:hypothetical protein Leryth_020091 [Lithospermum erythrorhizon]
MDMDKDIHVIEITVISGEGLRISRKKKVKTNSFVILRTNENHFQKTMIDKRGGDHPLWNEKMIFRLPKDDPYLIVEVRCKQKLGNVIVGLVQIPVSDLVQSYVQKGCLQYLSYRLRDAYGEENGLINIAARVVNQENDTHLSLS